MGQPRRVALVTGAGSGIGREVARQLAHKNWQIAALDRHLDGLKALQEELGSAGLECTWRQADVTDRASLGKNVAQMEQELGAISLLVAAAGTAGATPATLMDAEAVERIIQINLIGVSNTVAAVLPGMLERNCGQIAVLSSLASWRALPEQMAYCASKAGLNAFLECLRLDVKRYGIVVTTLCPGWTRTALTTGRYHDAAMMDVKDTAWHVIKGIERKARVYAFPQKLVWQLRLMKLLPAWLQESLLMRRLRQMTIGEP